MSRIFQEKKGTFFLFIGLLFILLAVLYFAFLRPISTELKTSQSNLQSLESNVEKLRKELETEPNEAENTLHLEKQVPLARDLEDLILSLQEIELVTGSRIESIQFKYDKDIKNEEIENLETKTEDELKANKQADEKEPAEKKEKNAVSSFPEELNLVTASLIVMSPDYDHFMQFIEEVEQLERITFVETLDFVKPAENELLFVEKPNSTIAFTVEITTFYYEEN